MILHKKLYKEIVPIYVAKQKNLVLL